MVCLNLIENLKINRIICPVLITPAGICSKLVNQTLITLTFLLKNDLCNCLTGKSQRSGLVCVQKYSSVKILISTNINLWCFLIYCGN